MKTIPAGMVGPMRLPIIIVALLAACGSSETHDCLDLARQYAAAMPAALVCDPSLPTPCGAQRPTIVYQQDGQVLTLEGLSYCTHAVAAGRSGELDAVLRRFRLQNCAFLFTPYWPPNQRIDPPRCVPGEACTQTDAGWSCAP
jgi:hypothetical protein